MTQEEARIIVENAKPIVKPTGNTVNLTDEQKNNTFKDIMKRWKKK